MNHQRTAAELGYFRSPRYRWCLASADGPVSSIEKYAERRLCRRILGSMIVEVDDTSIGVLRVIDLEGYYF